MIKPLFLLAMLMVATPSAFSQSRYDPYPSPYLRPTENATQSKLDELQRRLDQSEFERQLERHAQKAAAEEAADAARQEAEERAEKAKQDAEDRAADLENRERISSASNRNFIYEMVAFLFFGLALYKVGKDKRRRQENILNPHEKTGVVIAMAGIAISLIALFISGPWVPQLDIWQHIMSDVLTCYSGVWPVIGWIEIQTKFVLLPCIFLIFYGVLVYLEILNAPSFLMSRFEGQ